MMDDDDDDDDDDDEDEDDDDDDDYRFFICRLHNYHSYKSPTESMGQTVNLSTLIP